MGKRERQGEGSGAERPGASVGESGGGGESSAKALEPGCDLVSGEVLMMVAVDAIEVSEQALRYCPEDDDIIELAGSIASQGLLQPVGVSWLPGGRYQLLWGGRRLAAHKRLRLPAILARVYRAREGSVKAVALTENLQRRQLTLQEECDAVHHLHFTEERSPEQIAALLSVSRSWVLRRLALPGLPVELREPCFDGRLSVGAAEAIAGVEDSGARGVIAQEAINRRSTVREVEAMVEVYQRTPSVQSAVEAGVAAAVSAVQPCEVYLECGACGRPRKAGDLVVIRVCGDGCSGAAEVSGKVEQ
jgi:ParB family chromosome partitioning protein